MSGNSNPTKQRVLLLTELPAYRHPIVHMAVKALGEDFDLTIVSSDPDATSAVFPGVECISAVPNYSLRALLGLKGRQNTSDGRPAVEVAQSKHSSDAGHRGIDIGLLIHHAHTTLWRAIKILRRARPAFIITIDAGLLPTARVMASMLRIPYSYWVCEIFPNQYSYLTPRDSKTRALIERFGAVRARRIIVVGEPFAKLLARRYGINRDKFVTINVCPEIPLRAVATNQVSAKLRLYYAGGYTPGRGLENLITAMRDVPQAHLYMRMFGPRVSILEELVKQCGLQDRVSFLEPVAVEKLADAAVEFDVGITVACPNSANGRFVVGYKFFEYMAAGLATVCPDSYVLGPFLASHSIGQTFQGCSPEAIAGALRYCVENPDSVGQWKKQARGLAETEFNFRVQGARLRQVVDQSVHQ